MEQDRAEADIGQAIKIELDAEQKESLKQPKKRFVGRRAAAERAEQHHGGNSTIEDSGAIQGVYADTFSMHD